MTFQFQETPNPLISKDLEKDLEFGMKDYDIVILQDLLKDLGYFPVIDSTGYYGAITVKAVIDFQLKNGIIKTENSPGAGRCGPATRAYINSNY